MRTANKKQKNKILLICVTVLMSALCLASLLVFICSFLPIAKFEVYGATQYEMSEIVGLSGLQYGDKLYGVDTKEVRQTMLESCYYLEDVRVERKFPNKVVFTVVEKAPMWFIAVSGDYYVLDSELRVIDESQSMDSLISRGATQLVIPEVRELICGELPSFGGDEDELRAILELVDIMHNSPMKSRMTLVSMKSRFEINITIDGKYNVELGALSGIEDKLAGVYNLISRGELDGLAGANIYVSDDGTPVVRPVYS